jgi:hypothetical protein
MPRAVQWGKWGNQGRPALRVLASVIILIGLTALGVAGCTGQHKREEDPLVGPGPKGLQKTDPGTTTKTKSEVPPIPTATATGSNAALVVGDPLTGSRALGIDDRRAAVPADGWQGVGPDGRPIPAAQGRWDGVRTASGTVLQRPQPIVEPVPAVQPGPPAVAGNGVPAVTPPAVPAVADSLDQLQAALKARGVLNPRVEQTPRGVRVTCAMPEPGRPDALHFYDAEAADQAAALRALLTKIDQTPRR